MGSKLTAKQDLFCREYIVDLNATQAAIRTGYSEKTANRIASQLLSKLDIQEFIAKLMEERNKKVEINSDWVLKQLKDIHELDIIDIVDDGGNLLPITRWSKPWRMYISGMDIQEINSNDTQALIKKIKWPDKVKNLELIGKHTLIQAWNEKVTSEATVKVDSPLAERLTNGSKR